MKSVNLNFVFGISNKFGGVNTFEIKTGFL